jgi:Ca-activated chloride channel homolog
MLAHNPKEDAMRFVRTGTVLLTLALIISALSLHAATVKSDEDKTLSPYFVIKTEGASVEQFSLKSTSADVNIAGVIADVKVTQVYQNRGKIALECIYVFPASSRAAVYAMKMTIGERTIVAKIEEKKKAREEYEKAKSEGKSASLLEQERPNVFQMNVANIMPGDEIKVQMQYTELLVPTDGVYEFDYPTVVGPRYSNQKEAKAPESDKFVKTPYQHEGEAPSYTFDLTAGIAAGMSIAEVTCASHKVNVSYDAPGTAKVKLDASEKQGGNRDFILRYRLEGGKIQSGLLLYKGETENFFLLMMQPPKKVAPAQVPPREYIFIMDVSGSMSGFPLDISKKLIKDLIGGLRPTDKFNILLFAGGNCAYAPSSVAANKANVDAALKFIDTQQGGGGTELLPALKYALALPGVDKVSRTVVIATDGYVDVEKEAFDLIRNSLGQANMFAFGIGSSVNRFLIEGMAHVGNGEPFIIEDPEAAPAVADKFRKLIESPVLAKVKVDYGTFSTYDVEPASIPDVLAQKPVVVYGKYRGEPAGKITLTGLTGAGKYEATVEVGGVKPQESNGALRYLWARKRIELLDDYNKLRADDERVKEVTNLGLTYNLLTAYTSFIAIDSEVRNKDGKSVTSKQPLPLPEGVSDNALPEELKKSSASSPPMAPPPPSPRPPSPSAMPGPGGGSGGGGGKSLMYEMAPQPTCEHPLTGPAGKPPTIPPAPSRPENVIMEDLTAAPGIGEDAIAKAFAKSKPNLEKCYKSARAKSAGLSGSMTVKLTVNAQGKVTFAGQDSGDLADAKLIDCILGELKRWTLPAPGKEATITFTLYFTP